MFTVHVTCIELLQDKHVHSVYVTGIELLQNNHVLCMYVTGIELSQDYHILCMYVTGIELSQDYHVLCMYVTGIELSQDNPEEVWSVKVDPEEEDDDQGPDRDFMIHQLYVKMVSPSVADQSDAWGILRHPELPQFPPGPCPCPSAVCCSPSVIVIRHYEKKSARMHLMKGVGGGGEGGGEIGLCSVML